MASIINLPPFCCCYEPRSRNQNGSSCDGREGRSRASQQSQFIKIYKLHLITKSITPKCDYSRVKDMTHGHRSKGFTDDKTLTQTRAGADEDWNPTLTMLFLFSFLMTFCFRCSLSCLFLRGLSPTNWNLYNGSKSKRFVPVLDCKITFNTIDNLIWKPQRSRSGGWWSENHWTMFWFAVAALFFFSPSFSGFDLWKFLRFVIISRTLSEKAPPDLALSRQHSFPLHSRAFPFFAQ